MPFEQGDLRKRLPSPADLKPFEASGVPPCAQVQLTGIPSEPRVHVMIPATQPASLSYRHAGPRRCP